jgi:anti-sigma regulatory factor (Ser/Thr protein kinase)
MLASSQSAPPAPGVDCDVRLPAAPTSVREARSLAEAAASAVGLGDEDTFQFKLATSEAVANAVEHGSPCDDGRIQLQIREQPRDALTVSVFDCGTFAPPAEAPDELSDRGRGLEFIAMFMDEVELRAGPRRTMVRITKHYGPAFQSRMTRSSRS